jgi:hypothetical protein
MKLKIGMSVLEQHESVVIKGAIQHAAELLLSNGSLLCFYFDKWIKCYNTKEFSIT